MSLNHRENILCGRWFPFLSPLTVDIYCSWPLYALDCCVGYHVEFVQKLKAPDVPEMQFVITFALDCDLTGHDD